MVYVITFIVQLIFHMVYFNYLHCSINLSHVISDSYPASIFLCWEKIQPLCLAGVSTWFWALIPLSQIFNFRNSVALKTREPLFRIYLGPLLLLILFPVYFAFRFSCFLVYEITSPCFMVAVALILPPLDKSLPIPYAGPIRREQPLLKKKKNCLRKVSFFIQK